MSAQGNIVKRGWLAVAIVVAILVIDQVIKIWVKTHMMLHEQIEVLSWFKIVFIENNGMAYGMEIGSKLVLSLFRIVAIGLLGWYISRQVRHLKWIRNLLCGVYRCRLTRLNLLLTAIRSWTKLSE